MRMRVKEKAYYNDRIVFKGQIVEVPDKLANEKNTPWAEPVGEDEHQNDAPVTETKVRVGKTDDSVI